MRARLLAVLAVLAAAPAARAQGYYPPPPQRYGPAETGINLGGRLGYGWSGGDISAIDPALHDYVPSKVPIWLELGLRMNRSLWGSLYLELAPATLDSTYCPSGASCSASAVRFGADLQYHVSSYAPVDPWFGIGLGLEFLSTRAYDPSTGGLADFDYSGFEFPLLEAGVDFAVTPRFALGPYLSLSFGQYTSATYRPEGGYSTTSSIDGDRTTHSWIELGVKGTFKL